MDSRKIVETAKALASTVGARIRTELQSETAATVSHKGLTDIVTEIDLWSEQEIVGTVAAEYPDHLVIGEETSAKLAESRQKSLPELVGENVCWIVDPLDGTTNFSNKLPHCAVSIGIADRGELVAGVVYDPARDEMFEAVKGGGAFLNGRPIHVSKKSELIQCLVAIGFANDRWERWDDYRGTTEAIIMSCRNVRSCGAAAIEACWVACGRFDGFFEYNIKAWDIAAAALIVAEAGGIGRSFGNTDGKTLSLFARSYIFSGKEIHPLLVKVVETKKAIPPKCG